MQSNYWDFSLYLLLFVPAVQEFSWDLSFQWVIFRGSIFQPKVHLPTIYSSYLLRWLLVPFLLEFTETWQFLHSYFACFLYLWSFSLKNHLYLMGTYLWKIIFLWVTFIQNLFLSLQYCLDAILNCFSHILFSRSRLLPQVLKFYQYIRPFLLQAPLFDL